MPHGVFAAHRGALESGGEKAGAPVVGSILRHAAWIGNGDVGRQILVLATERIRRPGTKTREAIEHGASGEEVLRRAMRVGFAGKRMHEGDVIRQFREVRDHVAHPLAGLATRTKGILRSREITRRTLEGHRRAAGQWLSVPLDQLGFVIPGLKLTHRPCTEDDDHVLRLGREMRAARCKRPRRVDEDPIVGE